MQSVNTRKTIRVGIPGPWKTINPGLQHTVYGDLVLSNQLEALVGYDPNGVPVPLGAKSWKISGDFTRYSFKIDRSKKFPNGESLSAYDFKRSWEEALSLTPKSFNSSLLDVLYKVKGYESFKETVTLSGIKALDDETLEINFSSPFRMALEHLMGNRFAAYKKIGTKFQGTGVYTIEEIDENHLKMYPNEGQSLEIPILDVEYIEESKIADQLLSGEIDVIHYLHGNTPFAAKLIDPRIEMLAEQDSAHFAIGLNTQDGMFARNMKYRKAFQYLIWQAVKEHRNLLPGAKFFSVDPQFLLPLQAGRLSETEVLAIIDEGQKDASEFLAATKKSPLRIHTWNSYARALDLIKETGISVTEDSGIITRDQYLKMAYADKGPDLLVFGFSVANGDPDGIYHMLGHVRDPDLIWTPTAGSFNGNRIAAAQAFYA